MNHIIFVWTELIAPSGYGRKDSFLRRMRRTIGYTGRYLFPCPFSAGLSPLFSSALVTFFPSSPRTVISFFAPISPFRFYPATGVSSRLFQQAFSCPSSFRLLRSAFSPLIFASLFLRRTAFLLLAPYSLSPFSFPFPALVTSLPPLLRPLLSALFSAHLHRPLFRLFRSLPVTQKT